ncbi:MAG: lipopolysaccharide biosynthesis protein [Nitrososphaerales archaeon]
MKLIRNTIALVGTQAVTSILGFVYWWLAARRFPASSVGLASATVSAMTLLGTLGMLGLGTLLIGELPRQRTRAPQLVTTAVLVAGAASGLFGVLFALVAPLISAELGSLAAQLDHLAIFALGTAVTGMGLVFDQAAVGVMRSSLQFWRNTIFSVAKLLALLALALWLHQVAGFSIFVTWVAGAAISLVAVVLIEIAAGKLHSGYRPQWDVLQGKGREALQHHGLNLVLLGPGLFLPLVVTAMLSAEVNAYFYTAWMVNNIVMFVPVALGTALYAAGSESPETLRQKLRLTLGLSLAYGLLTNLILAVAGTWFLGFFGPQYAQAAPTLVLLNLTVIPVTITEHYVALRRIERRPESAVLPLGLSSVLKIVLAAVGARLGGLTGLSIGIVVASYLVAVFLLPSVIRALGASEWVKARTWRGSERNPF